MSKRKRNLLLLVAFAALNLTPLLLHASGAIAGEFEGADTQAKELITELHPDYKPWFSPIWEPPSGEIESLLFGLQAAIGSGLLFYYIGYHRGRKSGAA